MGDFIRRKLPALSDFPLATRKNGTVLVNLTGAGERKFLSSFGIFY